MLNEFKKRSLSIETSETKIIYRCNEKFIKAVFPPLLSLIFGNVSGQFLKCFNAFSQPEILLFWNGIDS